MPKLSIIMPVYNSEDYIIEAVNSMLNQTFTDFELIIINDGSTDNSLKIIESFKDNRIKIINNDKNLKLIRTLNKGLEASSGRYIARMDADDISHKKRLETQVNYLDEFKETAVLGTSVKVIGNKSAYTRPFSLKEYDDIKSYLYVNNCIVHPTTMFRSYLVKEYGFEYSMEYPHAEDYDFFLRISKQHKIEILKDRLLNYRINESSVSTTNNKVQLDNVNKISTSALKSIGIELDRGVYRLNWEQILEYKNILEQHSNDLPQYNRIISYLWMDICTRGIHHGFPSIFKLFNSIKNISKNDDLPRQMIHRLYIKSLLNYNNNRT
jgi:glycosyltransferase involved in cell wall biosynthesis